MFFPVMCGVIAVMFFVFSVLYLGLQMQRYKAIKNREIAVFSKSSIPKDIVEAALLLSDRKYRFIHNYFIFQLTNKVFGLISITYSVLGLISLSMGTMGDYNWLGYVICFISIIFVILALYLTPINKVSQYLSAWRICDKKMCEAMASSAYYASISDAWEEAEYTEEDKDLIQKEITAKRIKDIAIDIASTISEAEMILTTEGE